MASAEQIEAWTDKAADALKAKVGEQGAVIVMVIEGDKGQSQVAWRGNNLVSLLLLELGSRIVKDDILPKKIDRKNPKS